MGTVHGKRGISNDAGRVKSFFSSLIPNSSTLLRRRTKCVSLPLLFLCVTLTCSARLLSSTQCCPPNISLITIDHDDLFELPVLQGGG
jgi:hypothetical protein